MNLDEMTPVGAMMSYDRPLARCLDEMVPERRTLELETVCKRWR